MKHHVFLTAAALGVATAVPWPAGAAAAATETPEPRDARLAWWRDARFGMFIHWGPVSLKGTEIGWSRGGDRRGYGSKGSEIPVAVYDNLYKEFNPTRFDAKAWVALARAAGMKYMVFTSRHHDGFSMFDTRADDYKITSPESPFRRDVVRELADAAHAAGLPFGVYYSQPNWRHPDAFAPDRHERYLDYLRTQVRELCSNYGRLDIFWFDGLGKPARDYDGEGLVKIIRGLQPHIIINNRTGLPEDHDTPEQRVGKFQNSRPWESCITICRQWAWKPNDTLKSLEQCLRTLITCAGGDGNLLFNVGPMPTGEIEPRQVERLREMGAWLGRFGESIYGTRGGPFKPGKWGASTFKGNTVFLHVFEWPADGLTLPAIGRRILSAKVLAGGAAEFTQTDAGIGIRVGRNGREPIDTVIALHLDGPAAAIPPVPLPGGSLSEGKQAAASNVYQKMRAHGAGAAFDGDPGTRWATDAGTRQAWLEVDLGAPATFSRVVIDEWEGDPQRVRAFELQSQDGAGWKTFHRGSTLGRNRTLRFAPLTARRVRLNILEATEGPTLNEFEIHAK
ncbi:MAG: alpha-L-fucosidase [Verrucomicrobia bacterium]|nr:alpha-L-fucosidase [Verrucomicrobiota bacterium]